jgi:hypothetical protein
VASMRRILTVLLAVAASFSIACSNSKSTPPSQTASVSIALNPAPTSTTVAVGNTTGIQFKAVVSNDSNNYGVDWAITCSLSATPGACGTLSIEPSLHSASGTPVTYTPPTSIPTGSLSVNVTVFATADHTKNVITPVTVTGFTSLLKGSYVLQVKGSDPNLMPYQITGVFVFDGNGNITSGLQTLNGASAGVFSSTQTLQPASFAPSTYFIGLDGRGAMTLNVQSSLTTLTETFTFVVLSTSNALVAELDTNTGSGTLELQDSTAAGTMPTGAYAFVTSGADAGVPTGPGFGVPVPTAIGGVFNIDNNPSPGSISGNGSLADQDYYDTTGSTRILQSCVPPTGVTGKVSKPAPLGIITLTLTGATCFGTQQPGTVQFTGYIVDSSHIRLIESDDVNGSAGFVTAGIAISQGTSAGTFTNASLSGPYVFGVLGYDINAFAPSSFTSAGVLNADGNGNLTGISDTFYVGVFAPFTADAIAGTYVMDTSLIGRADVTPNFQGPPPQPSATVLLYLTGNGTPPLVLWSGGDDVNFPANGAGIAYPQAANASSLSFGNPEKYGLGFGQDGGNGEFYGTGVATTTISGAIGRVTGMVDDPFNNTFVGGTPFPLLDTFTVPADNFGRIAGTFMNASGTVGPFVEYYLIDDNHGFFVETDLFTLGEVTLGYFSQACDLTNPASCQASATQLPAGRAPQGLVSRGLRNNSNVTVH